MKHAVIKLFVAVASFSLLGWGSVAAAPPGEITINTKSRDAVIESYQQFLEPLLTVPVGWTGNVENCKQGTTSRENQQSTLKAVNYVRSLAGLPGVTLDAKKSKKSQAAALIMAANGYLTHYPSKDARCYTQAGYDGASHGNLFLGWDSRADEPGYLSPATGARAVVGYMEDSGSNNLLVGHRRWIMYQELKTIGSGDTDSSNSLYVVGSDSRSSSKKWVSWPTAGYFPLELEPLGRWSLSYPNADFSRAKVRVTTPAGPIKTKKTPVEKGMGDNTLSWDMTLPGDYAPSRDQSGEWVWEDSEEVGAAPAQLPDLPVTVTVSGIRVGGKAVTKKWTTTLVQAAQVTPVNVEVAAPQE